VTALAEIISEVRGALGVDVDVLTDPTMLVQLPNGNDGLPEDVGVLHFHGIRGSKIALDAIVSGLFGVSSPPSPEVALRHAEKTEFKIRLGIDGIFDIIHAHFAVISGIFRTRSLRKHHEICRYSPDDIVDP
jgi:hypothetical protein